MQEEYQQEICTSLWYVSYPLVEIPQESRLALVICLT